MAFGQPSGPPASKRDIDQLVDLLQRAGHSDFRDARGPMGFTQRQAAGKFTRDEAAAFIEQLEAELDAVSPDSGAPDSDDPESDDPEVGAPAQIRPKPQRLSASERAIRQFPDSVLAAELQRRGWVVMEP